ncbi:hypothetical protein [Streptomyces sp. NPDC054863]
MFRLRHRAVAGAAVLTMTTMVTTLTACGSGEPDAGPGKSSPAAAKSSGGEEAPAVRAAYQKTNDEKTARMVLRVQTTAEGKSVAVDGRGVVDLVGGNSDMTLGVGGEKVEQRVVDQVLYQKVPASQRSGVPGKKPWIRIDLQKAGQQQGGSGSGPAGNPAETAAFAKGVTDKDVRKLGTEEIGDTDTTHYRVNVDVAKLANGEQLKKQIGPTLPMDVWLDEDNRIRRQQTDMTISAPKGTGADSSTPKKVTVRTVLELSDFGTKVDVKAPPAAETADMTGKAARTGQ